jgi:hypothetical protein
MDERIRICFWMVGGGAFGAILGSVFGGLAGVMFAWSGHTAGTGLARRLADTLARTAEREASPLGRAGFIGAADGFFFLGILGLIAGALLGLSGRPTGELLAPIGIGSVVLVGGAISIGSLAYALRYLAAEFLYVTAGGFLGSFLAATLLGSNYGPAGIVPGVLAGLAFCRTVRRYAPTFHPPQVGKTVRSPRADANTDISGPSSSSSKSDFFGKADTFEER